jgi:hypothetical protein
MPKPDLGLGDGPVNIEKTKQYKERGDHHVCRTYSSDHTAHDTGGT